VASVNDIIALIESVAPKDNKCDFDNVGLLVGRRDAKVNKVMICLDATKEVLDEAIKAGAQMIISHHPMIFDPIKAVSSETVLGEKIILAIENGIAIYAAHTNLDFSAGGINDFVAELLGLTEVTTLDPYISENEGLGRVGKLSNACTAEELKNRIEKILNDKYIRIIGEPNSLIKKVAVINGSGGDIEYIDMAKKVGADCLVTAEVKHHVAIYAREKDFTIIECQHYTMEHCYLESFAELLKSKAVQENLSVEFIQSKRETNPKN
jgi:dinuclear metal center YbgI/SA1388 family protein